MLAGAQHLFINGEDEKAVKLLCEKEELEKPIEIKELAKIVTCSPSFASMAKITSVRKPYGLSTDVIKTEDATIYDKYKIGKIYTSIQNPDDITIYAKSGLMLYVPNNYDFPRKNNMLEKYKVLIPYAWGNMSEKSGLGGAFSDIIIAFPHQACTETYLESGPFDTFDLAKKHAKYLMTKFCRALLYVNKFS